MHDRGQTRIRGTAEGVKMNIKRKIRGRLAAFFFDMADVFGELQDKAWDISYILLPECSEVKP